MSLEIGDIFSFKIENIDSFGQGVHKEEGFIAFIPKTLVGETGEAIIERKAKGVYFAKLRSISKKSAKRINPDCPHFDQCQACSYLHTTYENECEIKYQNFLHAFKRLGSTTKPQFIKADNRFHYRNRVQLHYNKKLNLVGYKYYESGKEKILEVPHCKLVKSEIQREFDQIYQEKSWTTSQKKASHIEISEAKNGEISRSYNRPYSHQGFTQVNQLMNLKAHTIITNWREIYFKNLKNALDLFGGQGNLSKELKSLETIVVDSGPKPNTLEAHQRYIKADLYSKNALKDLNTKVNGKQDLILFDPPRSGFKEINDYVEAYNPRFILAMSCNHQTFIRDIQTLKNVEFVEVFVLDFFPSTHHFEVLSLLKVNEKSHS